VSQFYLSTDRTYYLKSETSIIEVFTPSCGLKHTLFFFCSFYVLGFFLISSSWAFFLLVPTYLFQIPRCILLFFLFHSCRGYFLNLYLFDFPVAWCSGFQELGSRKTFISGFLQLKFYLRNNGNSFHKHL
jgi:hypothetical protein